MTKSSCARTNTHTYTHIIFWDNWGICLGITQLKHSKPPDSLVRLYPYPYFINEEIEGQSISNVNSQKLVSGGFGIKTGFVDAEVHIISLLGQLLVKSIGFFNRNPSLKCKKPSLFSFKLYKILPFLRKWAASWWNFSCWIKAMRTGSLWAGWKGWIWASCWLISRVLRHPTKGKGPIWFQQNVESMPLICKFPSCSSSLPCSEVMVSSLQMLTTFKVNFNIPHISTREFQMKPALGFVFPSSSQIFVWKHWV